MDKTTHWLTERQFRKLRKRGYCDIMIDRKVYRLQVRTKDYHVLRRIQRYKAKIRALLQQRA